MVTSVEELESDTYIISSEDKLIKRVLPETPIDIFKNKFNISLEEVYNIDKLLKDGYLIKENNYLKINKKYMYISNEIIVRILE